MQVHTLLFKIINKPKMNENKEFLFTLAEDLNRVLSKLRDYETQIRNLSELDYTPNTIVLMKNLHYYLKSENLTSLEESVHDFIVQENLKNK
jgi:hypothetical protein